MRLRISHYIFFSLLAAMAVIACACSRNRAGGETMSSSALDSLRTEVVDLRKQGAALRQKSEFSKAVRLQNEALQKALVLGDTVEIVQEYNQLGTTFRRMGQMVQALECHYQARNLAELCSDTSYQARKNRVVSYNGLGNAHLTLKELDIALKYFRLGLEGETRLGSELGQAINNANIGSIYEEIGDLDSAQYYYECSMRLNKSIGDDLGVALCHTYFGQVSEKRGDFDNAATEYLESLNVARTIGDPWHILEPIMSLARLYCSQNELDLARPYIEEAMQMAIDIKSFDHLIHAGQIKAKYEEKRGNYKEAIACYQLYEQFSDSLLDGDKQRQILDVCINFERERWEKQNEVMASALEHQKRLGEITQWLVLLITLLSVVTFCVFYYYFRRFFSSMRQNISMNGVSIGSEKDQKTIKRLKELVEKQMIVGDLSLETLSSGMNMSKSSLNKAVRSICGLSASAYVQTLRMEKAARMLRETDVSIGDISMQCGFDDMSYFSRVFRNQFGVTPSKYRATGPINEK